MTSSVEVVIAVTRCMSCPLHGLTKLSLLKVAATVIRAGRFGTTPSHCAHSFATRKDESGVLLVWRSQLKPHACTRMRRCLQVLRGRTYSVCWLRLRVIG